MAEYAVQIAEVVARAVIAATDVLDEEAGSLAVLFRFVVLLAVFDESTFAVVGSIMTRLLNQLVGWRSAVPGLQLLAQALAGLRPVIALGVILRPGLPAGRIRFAVAFTHEVCWPQLPHQPATCSPP